MGLVKRAYLDIPLRGYPGAHFRICAAIGDDAVLDGVGNFDRRWVYAPAVLVNGSLRLSLGELSAPLKLEFIRRLSRYGGKGAQRK